MLGIWNALCEFKIAQKLKEHLKRKRDIQDLNIFEIRNTTVPKF